MILLKRIITGIAITFMFFYSATFVTAQALPAHAVAIFPTPVFHSPDITTIFGGNTLPLDKCGQLRELEFIAYPGTVFRVEAAVIRGDVTIYRVSSDEYPYPTDKGYFIDSRFVTTVEPKPAARLRRLPPRQTVLDNLVAARGTAYVWGGNFRRGVPQMLDLYPLAPQQQLSNAKIAERKLQGVDCSGLLYEATGGYTPRNTSTLINYGAAVPIAGMNGAQIIGQVAPLDLIAWNGHVMIILDRQRVIESRLDCSGNNGGVRIRPLDELLNEIMRNRIPVDSYEDAEASGRKGFVIRRWYDTHVASGKP
jgi:hypothetical protein